MEKICFRLFDHSKKAYKTETRDYEGFTMSFEAGEIELNAAPKGCALEVWTGIYSADRRRVFVGDIVSGETNRFEFVGTVRFGSGTFYVENGREKKLLGMLDPKTVRILGNGRFDTKLVESLTGTPYLPENDPDFDDNDPDFKGKAAAEA